MTAGDGEVESGSHRRNESGLNFRDDSTQLMAGVVARNRVVSRSRERKFSTRSRPVFFGDFSPIFFGRIVSSERKTSGLKPLRNYVTLSQPKPRMTAQPKCWYPRRGGVHGEPSARRTRTPGSASIQPITQAGVSTARKAEAIASRRDGAAVKHSS